MAVRGSRPRDRAVQRGMPAARLCLLLGLLAAACASVDPDPQVEDGYLFGYDSQPELNFIAVTSDTEVLAQLAAQLALPLDERAQHINGAIERGDGGHNLDWKWHFLPGQWALADLSIEVCDGTPDSLDADLGYWVDNIGRFCPWGARVLERLYD